MFEIDTTVCSAFPGTGKTYYASSINSVLDSDSSTFNKKDFPANYIRHIKENLGMFRVIMVSSHKEVRDALTKEGIPYTLVYPKNTMKIRVDYLKRFRERDSSEDFINLINANWDKWLKGMESQEGCDHVVLEEGQYLTDIPLIKYDAKVTGISFFSGCGTYKHYDDSPAATGGVKLSWSGSNGFGELTITIDDKGNLTADTETMGIHFVKHLLNDFADQVKIND